jgi:hypothetical protein
VSTPATDKLTEYAKNPAAFVEDLTIDGSRGKVRFGDVMADFQRKDFAALSPALLAVANGEKPEPSRYFLLRSKGGSKDTDFAVCLLWFAIFSPRALQIIVGAADRDQAGEVVKIFRSLARNNSWLAELIEVQQWAIVNARTGLRIDVVSSDAPSAHGTRPDVTWINELAHLASEDFFLTLLDNASKIVNGLVCVASNAGILDSFQHKFWLSALSSPRWYSSILDKPAPWLDEQELQERERTTPPNRFRRLWYSEFVPDTGDALSVADIEASVRAEGPMLGSEPGWIFAGGLDVGLVHDACGLVIVGKKDSRYRLAHCQRWTAHKGQRTGATNGATIRISLQEVEDAIYRAHERFKLRVLGFDPYQAELLAERLSKPQQGKRRLAVERVTFTGSNLTAMATMVLDTFNSQAIELYPHPQLLEDLKRLRIEEKSYGMRLSSPRGPSGHGDLATGLAVALLVAKDMKPAARMWIY